MTERQLKKIRPLGKLEQISAVAHHIDFFTNTGLSAQYAPTQTLPGLDLKEAVYDALSQVLAQHPVLFAIPVLSEGQEPYWGRLASIDLEKVVTFVDRRQPCLAGDQTDDELDSLLERQHNTNFKTEYGTLPVWRLVILKDHGLRNGFTASFIAHHSMTDGTGLQIFHDSFQKALGNIASSATKQTVNRVVFSNDGPIAPSLEELHPLPIPTSPSASNAGQLNEWRGAPIALPCHTRYKSLSLPSDIMVRFVQDCKKHRVAPTAALPSLVARLLYDNLPSTAEALTCNLPVSLRSDLPPKLVEGVMGNFIDAFKVQLVRSDLDQATDTSSTDAFGIWNHAKKIQQATRKYFANASPSGEPYANVAALKLIPDIGAALSGSIGHPRGESFEVSNLGTFSEGKNPKGGAKPLWHRGKVLLSRCAYSGGAPLVVCVLNNEEYVGFGFTWQDGSIEESIVQAVIDGVRTYFNTRA
ncbi:hypothetical protein FNAPI_1753 [Fusarium napiforme]|uniref:Alcohol acetyltransferase n=1 Tax=Fusarium napiforme TaxID=42672 RepID=A0A8H5K3C5_9HYPO|nr:hypothetical protein FNAPI_1753 [Fusarium napiforme]